MEVTGFRDSDRNSAAASGREKPLRSTFFDRPAFNELTRNFLRWRERQAGFARQFGHARDGTMLVSQAVNGRAVKLFLRISVTYLSLSARCHIFSLTQVNDLVTINDDVIILNRG